jgi:hypothetical protein
MRLMVLMGTLPRGGATACMDTWLEIDGVRMRLRGGVLWCWCYGSVHRHLARDRQCAHGTEGRGVVVLTRLMGTLPVVEWQRASTLGWRSTVCA